MSIDLKMRICFILTSAIFLQCQACALNNLALSWRIVFYIVESDVKHHNPNPCPTKSFLEETNERLAIYKR